MHKITIVDICYVKFDKSWSIYYVGGASPFLHFIYVCYMYIYLV